MAEPSLSALVINAQVWRGMYPCFSPVLDLATRFDPYSDFVDRVLMTNFGGSADPM